jgi:hypothetical protein
MVSCLNNDDEPGLQGFAAQPRPADTLPQQRSCLQTARNDIGPAAQA